MEFTCRRKVRTVELGYDEALNTEQVPAGKSTGECILSELDCIDLCVQTVRPGGLFNTEEALSP